MLNTKRLNDTPFTLVQNDETKQTYVFAGNNRVSTKEFNSMKEAEEYVNSKPWELIFNACGLLIESMKTEGGEKC